MSVPHEVERLIERFDRNRDAYLHGQYNEAMVRGEYIDPFFIALGWDVHNTAGYAEAYKDVIHEDAIKVGGVTKAPDYCFRIGPTRKFFVEAKRPSVNIHDDIAPAYQLRRYAWSANLPLSIVTDFGEFAVYDCRTRPKLTDKPSVGRTVYTTFDQYADRWDEIAAIFSKEAVLQGSFDKYAAGKGKRGTAQVDAEFLKEIESWREALARNIALRNDGLSVRDLNFAVQRTIDRIIFLRMCEDRGVEKQATLQALINGVNVYARLQDIFRQADERYNSGLFHFHDEPARHEPPDTLTPGLTIDDKVLKDIFKALYYPESPYEFSVLPADILGNVYEQFLGKVIRLTAGHRVKVEEKPEVKKAGGVYYTPKYIVDYIVKHTVGRLLHGQPPAPTSNGAPPENPQSAIPNPQSKGPALSPAQIGGLTASYRASKTRSPLRILDPACGSGSFLIGAYRYLLDYHRDWYLAHDVESHQQAGRIYQARSRRAGRQWHLATDEKKRILLTNIFGVDIDTQAVEVTKLNLLLAVLENETNESLQRQLALFHERALPDLSDNIKCGNSLIGTDFYQGKQLALFDDDTQYKINAFNWNDEFPDVFRADNPGFDAVIGNPPWGGDIDDTLIYFHAKFPRSTQDHTDSFKLFVDQGSRLVGDGGLVAMIVPNTVLRQRRLKDIRQLLLELTVMSFLDLGEGVFRGVVAPSCVFVVQASIPSHTHSISVHTLATVPPDEKGAKLEEGLPPASEILQKALHSNPDLEFRAPLVSDAVATVPMGMLPDLKCKDAGINYQRVKVGMQQKGKSDLGQRLLYEGTRETEQDKMYWKGADIRRYWIAESTRRFCRTNYSDFIRPNEVVRLNSKVYDTVSKILLRQTADTIIATLDQQGVWFGRSVIALVPTGSGEHRIEYILGILNSKYMAWAYHQLVAESGRTFAQVKLSKLKQLPIRTIDVSSPVDKGLHDRTVGLVETMFALHKGLSNANTAHAKTVVDRQITATDRQIDQLVYELYGLTEEEIRIVEEAAVK